MHICKYPFPLSEGVTIKEEGIIDYCGRIIRYYIQIRENTEIIIVGGFEPREEPKEGHVELIEDKKTKEEITEDLQERHDLDVLFGYLP